MGGVTLAWIRDASVKDLVRAVRVNGETSERIIEALKRLNQTEKLVKFKKELLSEKLPMISTPAGTIETPVKPTTAIVPDETIARKGRGLQYKYEQQIDNVKKRSSVPHITIAYNMQVEADGSYTIDGEVIDADASKTLGFFKFAVNSNNIELINYFPIGFLDYRYLTNSVADAIANYRNQGVSQTFLNWLSYFALQRHIDQIRVNYSYFYDYYLFGEYFADEINIKEKDLRVVLDREGGIKGFYSYDNVGRIEIIDIETMLPVAVLSLSYKDNPAGEYTVSEISDNKTAIVLGDTILIDDKAVVLKAGKQIGMAARPLDDRITIELKGKPRMLAQIGEEVAEGDTVFSDKPIFTTGIRDCIVAAARIEMQDGRKIYGIGHMLAAAKSKNMKDPFPGNLRQFISGMKTSIGSGAKNVAVVLYYNNSFRELGEDIRMEARVLTDELKALSKESGVEFDMIDSKVDINRPLSASLSVSVDGWEIKYDGKVQNGGPWIRQAPELAINEAAIVSGYRECDGRSDIVKVIYGTQSGVNISKLQSVQQELDRMIDAAGYGQNAERRQARSRQLGFYVFDKSAADKGPALQNEIARQIDRALEDTPDNGRVVVYALDKLGDVPIAQNLRDKYKGGTRVIIIADDYTDADNKDVPPNVMLRHCLARHIANYEKYTNAELRSREQEIICQLLNKVTGEHYDPNTVMKDLLELLKPLRIKPVDLTTFNDWEKMEKAIATAV
jgi:hypothetical protein